jgi:antitoxin component of MazEF toxin-antitoxin module
MLKKLAKYGNSTTLVIDKAILELLNMDESSVVKLQTDGKSLIITPISSTEKKRVSYGSEEAFQAAVKTRVTEQLEQSPLSKAEMAAAMSAMQEEFKQLFEKHKIAMAKFTENVATNQGFQEALALLAQKYDPVSQSEEYLQELHRVKGQFFPELAEMDKEMAALTQKYNTI